MAYRRATRRAYSGRRSSGYTRRASGYRSAGGRRTTGRRSGGARGGTIRIVVEQSAPSVASQMAGPMQVVSNPRVRQF